MRHAVASLAWACVVGVGGVTAVVGISLPLVHGVPFATIGLPMSYLGMRILLATPPRVFRR